MGAKYFDQRVCMSLCLSVHWHTYQEQHVQISPNFLYVLPVAVARSCFNGSMIHYAFPVLWMTSYFHITANGQNQLQCRVCFVELARWRHQSDVKPRPHQRQCRQKPRHCRQKRQQYRSYFVEATARLQPRRHATPKVQKYGPGDGSIQWRPRAEPL